MNSLSDFGWIIPVSPLAVGLLLGVLLLSFNRTMNRLSKPVSFLVTAGVLVSTIFSSILYKMHVNGGLKHYLFNLFGNTYEFEFYLSSLHELICIFAGLIMLLISIGSFYLLPRKLGYVSYCIILSITSSTLFFLSLSGTFDVAFS